MVPKQQQSLIRELTGPDLTVVDVVNSVNILPGFHCRVITGSLMRLY